MAISVNPLTFVITVPRADMTLIQSNPTEIRELDTNAFRLELKAWEDNGNHGITFLKTHLHNTEVTLSGINYARIIEIIAPYTITFENGLYAVNVIGSNNNILERTNKNQVSVNPNNSAGLISSTDIEFAQYENGIYVDQVNGSTGTLHPTGTLRKPAKDLSDVHLIADYRGVNIINFIGNGLVTTGDEFEDHIFKGQNANLSTITVDSDANVLNCEFKECLITGTLDGGSIVRDSIISNLNYVNGVIFNSMIAAGTILLGGGATAHFLNCYSGVPGTSTPIIDMGGSGQSLALRNYSGGVKLINKTGPESITLEAGQGQYILDDTVTNGTIAARGDAALLDTSGNTIFSGTWNGVTIVNTTTLAYLEQILATGGSLTQEQSDQLENLYRINGLDDTIPAQASKTFRRAGDIEIAISSDGETATYERQ